MKRTRRRSRGPTAGLLLAAALALAVPAAAQFSQYTPPGQFEERRESTQKLLQAALAEARWKAGRFYLDPWISLRDVAWIDNAQSTAGEGSDADLTATVGLGLRLYRPIGRELTMVAHALPEYVWWQELSDRSRLNGRYGVGLFGNLGRLGVEIRAARSEVSRFFSREVEVRVNSRDELTAARFEIDAGPAVSLFAAGSIRRIRSLAAEDLDNLDLLDRDERIGRAGIRLALGSGLAVGLGAESSEVEFDVAQANRSNSGVSPLVQLRFEGRGLDLEMEAAARDLEPEPGSEFIAYDDTTGVLRASLQVAGRSKLQLFAYRNLVYTVDRRWSYFEDSSTGLGWVASLGGGASLRLFAETGSNDYSGPADIAPDRQDDFDAWGATLRVGLGRFTLVVGGNRTSYSSNLPEFDREITVVSTGLVLGTEDTSPWF